MRRIDGQIGVTVNGRTAIAKMIDQSRDKLGACTRTTLFGKRFDGTRHDQGQVARQSISGLRVGEIS